MRRLQLLLLMVVTVLMGAMPASSYGGQQSKPKPSARPRAAAAKPPAVAIRFDGLYYQAPKPPEKYGAYVRFYTDGTFSYAWTEDVKGALHRINRATDIGRQSYQVVGEQIEFKKRYASDSEMAGTLLAGDAIDLRWQREEKKGFFHLQFMPLAASEMYARPFVTAEFKGPDGKPVTIKLELGNAGQSESCETASFTPLSPAEIFEYPPGTNSVAHRVSLDPVPNYQWDESIFKINAWFKCSTGGTQAKSCTKYAILQGVPRPYETFTVVSCADGQPIQPGSGTAEIHRGQWNRTQIHFEVK